jgi:hypothetical protein
VADERNASRHNDDMDEATTTARMTSTNGPITDVSDPTGEWMPVDGEPRLMEG